MSQSILITQCLQEDFVKPFDEGEPLPNKLHVGYSEAKRLMGANQAEGPVARMMAWAYRQPPNKLRIIHIRDWHDPADETQESHIALFGAHCLADSPGADFAFREPSEGRAAIVNSLTLNDFHGATLEKHLEPFAGQKINLGVMGVWTEAKVTFLAYELATRYPEFRLAVCSALAASSSTLRHYMALDQLERLLGVTIHHSMNQFIQFLGGEGAEAPLPGVGAEHPSIEIVGNGNLSPIDGPLIKYLFRDCKSVSLRSLDGGFSGNLVLAAQSVDAMGHQQAPHVVKIGPRDQIGMERSAFERIESVLGNHAPSITEFADHEKRGALKYRYASMGKGSVTSFQKMYMEEEVEMDEIERALKEVFKNQLGRLYAAATLEKCSLLEYYMFSRGRAFSLRKILQEITPPDFLPEKKHEILAQSENLLKFYEEIVPRVRGSVYDEVYFSYVHGDLNGANIVLDSKKNVWIIDFFHAHRGHCLKDLIKLENDLLYIFTPVNNSEEFSEAMLISNALLEHKDLSRSLPHWVPVGVKSPQFRRAYHVARFIRSFYPDLVKERTSPLQLYIGQLRYAAHNLCFEESTALQKRWALYTASKLASKITEILLLDDRLA
ncbi:MAG: isochorismatase [Nitrospinota bacterium]|nr:isochorismatase [Nitrospinota bacterium]